MSPSVPFPPLRYSPLVTPLVSSPRCPPLGVSHDVPLGVLRRCPPPPSVSPHFLTPRLPPNRFPSSMSIQVSPHGPPKCFLFRCPRRLSPLPSIRQCPPLIPLTVFCYLFAHQSVLPSVSHLGPKFSVRLGRRAGLQKNSSSALGLQIFGPARGLYRAANILRAVQAGLKIFGNIEIFIRKLLQTMVFLKDFKLSIWNMN